MNAKILKHKKFIYGLFFSALIFQIISTVRYIIRQPADETGIFLYILTTLLFVAFIFVFRYTGHSTKG